MLRQTIASDRGASMVEYAVILALICVVCIGVVGALGSTVQHAFHNVSSCLNTGGAQNPGGVCAGNAGGGNGNGNGNGNGGPGHGKP